MPRTPDRWWILVLAMFSACGSSSVARDASVPVDAALPSLNGCTPERFVDLRAATDDARMVMVPRGTKRFDLPCVVIARGQSLSFMWDFATHALASGPAAPVGTSTTPITSRTEGTVVTVVFAEEGSYPFCSPEFVAAGMTGAVHVTP